jgi:hypothetical protein
MAVKEEIGGIQVNDHQFSTVLSVERFLRLALSGMAFEQDAVGTKAYEHMDERVAELRPARQLVQRSFYNPALKKKVVKDLQTGEKSTQRVPDFVESAKLRNAKGDLLKYIKGPYIDAPDHAAAAMPAFVVYFPEKLSSAPAIFNAGMEGEFFTYDLTGLGKAMILDGESRHYALERALNDSGANTLSGPRKEILRRKLVTVEVHHGLEPAMMGQIFADLNGKGVKLNSNEVASRDIRDPWAKATRQIFLELGIPLQSTGRQVSAASQAAGLHLMFHHARVMVRALGIGSFSGATSTSERTDGINFDRVVSTGVEWFRIVFDHFDGPAAFTDPDRVLRAMPVKVAIGLMGHAWYDTDLALRQKHIRSLSEINWRVRSEWNGIAGKVTGSDKDGYKLSASGAKEIGTRAARAITNPESADGKRIRPGT